MNVTALSDDGQRTLANGALTVINNQIDMTTATIQLKATFANQNNALWPGLSVETEALEHEDVTASKRVHASHAPPMS